MPEMTSNGNRFLETDTVPDTEVLAVPNVLAVPPQQIFQAQEPGPIPKAKKLTPEMQEFLSAPLPPLNADTQIIRGSVGHGEAAGEVEQYAHATFDSEPCRSNRRYLAGHILQGAKMQHQYFQEKREREIGAQDTKPRTDTVLVSRKEAFGDWASIPKVISLLFFLSLFVFGFFAEFKNSVYLVTSSGLGFEGDFWGAVCFVFPIVIAPFIALKYLERSLSDNDRERFTKVLNQVTSPLALGTVGLFSWTIGMMHSDVDLLAAGSESWTPPLWALLLGEMVLLALMVTMLATYLRSSMLAFFEYVPCDNAVDVESTTQVAVLDDAIFEIHILLGQMENILSQLKNEREKFVKVCLKELDEQQASLEAKRAQLKTDPLTS